jgi:uncharacterized membrane protein
MLSLLLAASFFVGIHLVISGTGLRDRLVHRLGPGPYRGLFSLASLGGIVWLGLAYNRAPTIPTWGPLVGLKPIALIAMLIAFGFVTLGLTTPSPTSVGGETLLARPPFGIQRITRHPFLWGVALWAAIHLIVNGDLASLVLFGSLGVLALAGTASIDRKRRAAVGVAWEGFARATSNVPFQAILQGRNRLRLGEHKPWQWLAVLVAFGLLAGLHASLFGVSALPGPG